MWLARDSDGGLILFRDKPTKRTITINPDFPKYKRTYTIWETEDAKHGCNFIALKGDKSYPWVTFENSQVEVELTLKNKYI